MLDTTLEDILQVNFRANPNYTLVLFDRLPPDQQEVLKDLLEDPDFYGILRPADGSGLGVKSACRDTALLYLTLQQPGRLPMYIKEMFGEECNQEVASLVLDGVIEIEWNGGFVSGSDAHKLLYKEADLPETQSAITRLSLEALKYAQELEINDVTTLSSRLYFYNRLPASGYWKRKLSTSDAVVEYLGLNANGPNWAILDRNWLQVPAAPDNDVWLVWRARHVDRPNQTERASSQPTDTYKLYISPRPEYLPRVLAECIEVFSRFEVFTFKVGKDVHNLLRPDKIIAYFWSMDELNRVADQLAGRLEGVPAHGVPFTAELSGDGLLSWGTDPPKNHQTFGWQARESWRLWVTNRLATALLSAKSKGSEVEPWRFALDRLRLEGIDTYTWAPEASIWREV